MEWERDRNVVVAHQIRRRQAPEEDDPSPPRRRQRLNSDRLNSDSEGSLNQSVRSPPAVVGAGGAGGGSENSDGDSGEELLEYSNSDDETAEPEAGSATVVKFQEKEQHNAAVRMLTEGHNAAVRMFNKALKEQHNAAVTELKRQCEELTEGHNKALKEQADGHSRTVGSMVGRLNSSLW